MAAQTDMEKREADQEELNRRNAQFQADWEEQQRKAYPEIYRRADQVRKQMDADEEVRRGNVEQRIVGLEPGHDPTRQAANLDDKELLENIARTAGDDNGASHETTPQAASSTPNPPVVDEAEATEEEVDEEKPKGGRRGKAADEESTRK